jgi:DNA ligase-1
MFENVLERGYEGLILKAAISPYKYGRTTLRENLAYKVKPYKTFDAKIVKVEERFENTSESYINELGKSQKHNNKSAMIPTGIAGSFIVICEEVEQRVNITGTEEFRRDVWNNRDNYVNKWIEFKGMLIGAKDKIRHPVFLRFREDRE